MFGNNRDQRVLDVSSYRTYLEVKRLGCVKRSEELVGVT